MDDTAQARSTREHFPQINNLEAITIRALARNSTAAWQQVTRAAGG